MTLNELIISIELGLILSILALGIFITFRIIDFPDLTCDGSFALGSVISAVMIKANFNPLIALFFAAIAGAIAGGITAFLNRVIGIKALLAGILVAFMLYSINLRIMGGLANISTLGKPSIFIIFGEFYSLIAIVLILVCILSIIFYTDFGLSLRAAGKNIILSKNLGISITKSYVYALCLSNALIALSGALLCQYQGFADANSGTGMLIIGLVSVMLGERFIDTKSIAILLVLTVFGAIIYRIFIAISLGSSFLGLQSHDLNLITGLMVIAIMWIKRKETETIEYA